jgi:hypothetical protein
MSDLSDEHETAIECGRELLRLGLPPIEAKKTLILYGFSADVVDHLMKDYLRQHAAVRARRRAFGRAFGVVVFLGSGGLFVYYALFNPHIIWLSWSLATLATFGLLKALLP